MEKNSAPNIDTLREQIDKLEEQIRQAEIAAADKMEELGPIKSQYKWKAPDRIFNPKGKQWYTTVAMITTVIIAYAALTSNYFLILSLVVLLMLLYALNTFPPNTVEHEITNKGLTVFDRVYTWDKILNFWVTTRNGEHILNFTLFEGNVNRMILLQGDGDINKIVEILVKRVDYLNPGGGNQDILTRYMEGKHVPLTKFIDVFQKSKELNSKK